MCVVLRWPHGLTHVCCAEVALWADSAADYKDLVGTFRIQVCASRLSCEYVLHSSRGVHASDREAFVLDYCCKLR